MDYGTDRAYAEISLSNLASNYKNICAHVKNAAVMGIVKCNAYGHGAVMVARELISLGCRYLALATIEEAAELRENGIPAPLLILGPVASENADYVIKYGVALAVFDYDYAKAFSDAAEERGKKIPVHLKLDTGMSRYGIRTGGRVLGAVDEILKIASLGGLEIEGIFSHMPCGDDSENDGFNKAELREFSSVLKSAEEKGIRFTYRHIASSGSVISYPESHFDMVRPGILLYGYFADKSQAGSLPLKPVMQLKTRVMQIKTLPEGTGVSYGRTFVADRDIKAAVVGIGYGDGLMRASSNKAHMLVRGKRAKILGRVCMDAVMIDITGIEGVKVGDTVTVFGDDCGAHLPLYDYLDAVGTISYEFLSGIGIRVPRIYVKNDRVIARQDAFSKTTILKDE